MFKQHAAISIYANETEINVLSGKEVKRCYRSFKPWFRKGRININASKCTSTLFFRRLRHYRSSTRPGRTFNENVTWTNEIKWLGVTLDSKLTYSTHISCILLKANYGLKQVFPNLYKSSSIEINLGLIILIFILLSTLTHASPISGCATNTYTNKLQIFQNEVLSIFTKLQRVTPNVTLRVGTAKKPYQRQCIKSALVAKTAILKKMRNYNPSVIKICVLISLCKTTRSVRPS